MGGLFTRIADFFRNMERKSRTRLIVLVVIAIIIIIVVATVLGQTAYATLYSGLDPADAGEVLTMLEELGVDAKTQGSGTILVPEQMVSTLRMQLASQGVQSAEFSTEIFQNAAGLGVTDMEKQAYLQWQQAENIRQTIERMDKVDKAAVHLSVPEDSPFVIGGEDETASASVMLTLKGGDMLSGDEAKTIAEMVASSISSLKVENVRIMDTQMNLYTIPTDDEMGMASTQRDLQRGLQSQMQTQVINLLNPVFGDGNVLAEVNLVLNFDTKVTESIVFQPPIEGSEDGIAVSMKELTETIRGDETGGVAGLDANGGASVYPALEGDEDATYQKISKEVNYEINQTKTMIEEAKGQVDDISATVILNSEEILDDYTQNVMELVATAIGVDATRITVEMLPFKAVDTSAIAAETEAAIASQQEMLDSMQGASTMRLIIMLVAGIAGLVILLMIVRTLMSARKRTEVEHEGGIDLVADEEIVPDASSSEIHIENKEDNRTVLGEYINENPETAANLLRNWLNDED